MMRPFRLTRSLAFLLVWISLATEPVASQTPTASTSGSLQQSIDNLLLDPLLRGASVGVLALRADNNQTLYEKNADLRFIPASNVKIVTSATALLALGKDHRFTTRVTADSGAIHGRTVHGNLYLIGSGDPSLTTTDLARLSVQIKNVGIREVTGSIIGDESLFPEERWNDGWNWDDLVWYYAPEISALSVNRNQVDITVKPTVSGSPTQVTVTPATRYLSLVNRSSTTRRNAGAGSASDVDFRRDLDSKTITITGTIAEGQPAVVQGCSVPRPALFAANELMEQLRTQGVTVRQSPRTGSAACPQTVVGSVTSSPLSDLLRYMNKHSDNHYAEQLLRLAGLSKFGAASRAHGLKAVGEFLRGCEVEATSYRMVDGSGLSRFNLFSPRDLVRVLRRMKDLPEFTNSLPVAGVDGTLARRLSGTPLKGSLRAKTGTMTGVSCLSGYLVRSDGTPLIFSVMFTNFTGGAGDLRRVQDEICRILYVAEDSVGRLTE